MAEKILIISNRVLSETDNNGKTLYSIIKDIPRELVSQLYFYENNPTISGYNYFQLSDKDIIRGLFDKKKRGRRIPADVVKSESDNDLNTNYTISSKYGIRKNDLLLLIREALWKHNWKSEQLDKWLDDFRPDTVFFMAGDCLYAYRICAYIVNRHHCRLMTYVTDDYVLPRSKENKISGLRRVCIKEMMHKCVMRSQRFFTISGRMQTEYKRLFGKDSEILINKTESLREESLCEKASGNSTLIFFYAGSMYYGREDILFSLAKEIKKHNYIDSEHRAELHICCNVFPGNKFMKRVNSIDCVKYMGALDKNELKEQLNLSNVLVFVESFEKKYIEKIRLSFSTKVPEYMSVGKPILAVGPEDIGSMDMLKNCAFCVTRKTEIGRGLGEFMDMKEQWSLYSKKAVNNFNVLQEGISKL